MKIEEARRIANEKFTKLIQPLIDDPPVLPEQGQFQAQVEALKQTIHQETGYQVDMFYVQPLGFGLYEVATVFKYGEKRRRAESSLLFN